MPSLVQTIEHSPALIHAGPFANIAHGTNSVLADRIGLKLADYVVTECGFGADLGAEKFFDIVCRVSGMWPSAVVLVATCRAIKYHGGVPAKPSSALMSENPAAFKKGLANLEVHIRNILKFGVPVIVAINRFPFDRPSEFAEVEALCRDLDVQCAVHDALMKGGEGAVELTEKTIQLADAYSNPQPKFMYELSMPVEDKVARIAAEIYGAKNVYFDKKARRKLEKFVALGFGNLPICIAKTQSSLSDNPRALGVPKDWTLTVTDAQLSSGAGFLVIICGDMMLMPGLPKVPAAVGMDVDESGKISGMY